MRLTEEQKVNQSFLLNFLELPDGDLPKFAGNTPYGEFHTSWEWIMSVVTIISEHVQNNHDMQLFVINELTNLSFQGNNDTHAGGAVIDVYNDCVKFVTWYYKNYGVLGEVQTYLKNDTRFPNKTELALGGWNTGLHADFTPIKISLNKPLTTLNRSSVEITLIRYDGLKLGVCINIGEESVFQGYVESLDDFKKILVMVGINKE